MFVVFGIIMGIMMVFMGLETYFPRYKLPYKEGWIKRAIIFNCIQLIIVIIGNHTWEHYIFTKYDHCSNNPDDYCRHSFFQMNEKGFTPIWGGFIAYMINTWIFYWWHRIRHENYTMWLVFHQLHHSPERIETITSFFKHPLEIFANSVIMSILVYPILGLGIEANVWLSIFSALGEFFYHMNIKTPYLLGFIIQRPESHRVHHDRNKRFCYNYSDFPLWDILGGTFYNPREDTCETGFSDDKEKDLSNILNFKDVIHPKKTSRSILSRFISYPLFLKSKSRSLNANANSNSLSQFYRSKTLFYFMLILGCTSTFGYMLSLNNVRNIGFITVASPLPLVFSVYNGVETFSTSYEVNVIFNDNTTSILQLDNTLYNKLNGPYNRKNMYGVVLSHGPFFTNSNMIKIRDQILKNSICNHGVIAKELGYTKLIDLVDINVGSKTVGNENKNWQLIVKC
jgi:sterol desaturase/sphingolipid hydroxylase (fatty acid hydroxylase superfamily)